MEKTIEIPFGTKDSELKGWEYTIPENMEAEIKDGKIIVKQKESEDEKIRTRLIALVEAFGQGKYKNEMLTYLERQKEQKPESCDCSRDEESYTNGIHYVLMNPEAYGLIKQKPAEWSEEDEINLKNAIFAAEKEWGVNSYTASWLNSLRPQPHWKPSEEQMEVDLEKFADKIKTFQGRYKHPEIVSIKGAMAFMARMFYQYPNVARLWYDSLPKATMD